YINRLNPTSNPRHLAVLFEYINDMHSLINWNGQRYPHRATAARNDLAIDPNHLTLSVQQRPARITRVNCDIGLNERQVIASIAVNCTDNPYGHSGIQPKG